MKILRTLLTRLPVLCLCVIIQVQAVGQPAQAAVNTLQEVRTRGHVVCGVGEALGGLSSTGAEGRWAGLEVEFCAAVAAAVLGDRNAVKFLAVSLSESYRSLKDGSIDILLAGTPWTMSREADLEMRFAGPLFHDGQGLLVNRSFGVSSVLELSGASVCVGKGTGAEQVLADYFRSKEMRYQLVVAEKWDDAVKAYLAGQCTLLTGDLSKLAEERTRMPKSEDQLLLPELMTHQILGPVVRQNDNQWHTVVRWTLMALVRAEELGLNSGNVDDRLTSDVAAERRFLGRESPLGAALGLNPEWAYRIVRQVGSYAEIFDRTLGEKSPLKLPRGLNKLWSSGGIMVSAGFR